MKQLIVDYLPFEIKPEQINESMKENSGKLIVKGVLQRAEAKNQNGRIYPREILEREADKYSKEFIKQKLSSIVGVKIEVTKVVAKSKLSQNKEIDDFNGVKKKMLQKKNIKPGKSRISIFNFTLFFVFFIFDLLF